MIRTFLAITLFSASMLANPTGAQAEDRIELGRLECFVDAGSGFVFGSTKDVSCVFTPVNPDRPEENYFGVINKFGLDIGSTEQSFMRWLVIAPTRGSLSPGFLSGDYVGATASATVAVGLGANVLVGGSAKSFALQPLSVETQTGLNLAAGIAELELRSIE